MAGFPGVGGEFGPYAISGVLGRGGMGVVFEAVDRRLNRAVALKVLSPVLSEDEQFRSRFQHEAGVLARLDSPHVVQIFEYGEIDGCLYLAAQLIRGGDLKAHVEAHGALAPAVALELVLQVAEALVDAHELGIVHRDIKPSNILLRRRGEAHQAFLCDFGIARTMDSSHTRTGQVIGSIPYMPPEQHEGRRADIRSDIYALGCVLWDALSGRPPYQGTDIQIAMAHIGHPVPQLPGEDLVTKRVNQILARALAKDPQDRYQRPQELQAALTEAVALARAAVASPARVGGEATSAGATGAADRGARPLRKRAVPPQRRSPTDSVPTVAGGLPPEAPSSDGTTPFEPPPIARTRKRRRASVLVVIAALVLGGGGTAVWMNQDDAEPSGPATRKPTKQLTAPVQALRPSTKEGGTIRVVAPRAALPSLDPGEVYTPDGLNVIRLMARSLMFDRQTDDGHELVPDLAAGPGAPSDGGRTWTYRLRSGLRFSDGRPITSTDVAYGVLRASDPRAVQEDGTSPYLSQLLNLPADWRGTSSIGMDVSTAIETPDDATIVFHLRKPFYEFDQLMTLPQSAPVPKTKSVGIKDARPGPGYGADPVSSGPYRLLAPMTSDGFVLMRNPHWKRTSDPNRPALADRIEFRFFEFSRDGRAAVVQGRADLALGVGEDEQGTETIKGPFGTVVLLALNDTVAPLGDEHCRRAVAAAVDPGAMTDAYGAESGRTATTLLPPEMPGRRAFDVYDTVGHPHGNLELARAEMADCAKPDGFELNLAYIPGPTSDDYLSALTVALRKVGIGVNGMKIDQGPFWKSYCGSPQRVRQLKIGACHVSWSPDWHTGYGFLAQIADPAWARATYSYNSAVRSPEVRAAFAAALAEPDPGERRQAWARIDRTLVEEARLVPLFTQRTNLPDPTKLTNLVVTPTFDSYDLLRLGVR